MMCHFCHFHKETLINSHPQTTMIIFVLMWKVLLKQTFSPFFWSRGLCNRPQLFTFTHSFAPPCGNQPHEQTSSFSLWLNLSQHFMYLHDSLGTDTLARHLSFSLVTPNHLLDFISLPLAMRRHPLTIDN